MSREELIGQRCVNTTAISFVALIRPFNLALSGIARDFFRFHLDPMEYFLRLHHMD